MRAGILLYALILSLIFGLFLQFYLQNQLTAKRQLLLEKDRLLAELMVSLATESKLEKSGQMHFDQGSLTYRLLTEPSAPNQKVSASFTVHLNDGSNFQIKK